MKYREYSIRLFFNEIIKTSHITIMMEEAISGGGYPLSGLIDTLLTNGVDRLIHKMVNDNTGDNHEMRLNNAGLKMYWRLNLEDGVFEISIGGDQIRNYPRFVAAIRRFIEHDEYLR
jgi:hypothetical protein